jgi:hypothetical protein
MLPLKLLIPKKTARTEFFSLLPLFPVPKFFICVHPCHVLRGERPSAGKGLFFSGIFPLTIRAYMLIFPA